MEPEGTVFVVVDDPAERRSLTGLTNKQIAARLGVSSQAIDAHRAKAMDKVHASSVPELVRLMLRAGISWVVPSAPLDQPKPVLNLPTGHSCCSSRFHRVNPASPCRIVARRG